MKKLIVLLSLLFLVGCAVEFDDSDLEIIAEEENVSVDEARDLVGQASIVYENCADTDDGINDSVAGTTTAVYVYKGQKRTKQKIDECRNNMLIEFSCTSTNRLRGEWIECENGCFEGACINQEQPKELVCATNKLPTEPYCKTTGRIYITDMAVWNNRLYFGTNDHSSCENKGEVYEHVENSLPKLLGDYTYFKQQGMKNVRYGNNNIIVPGLDPVSKNNYELFVYDGSWNRHQILLDTSGHLVDAVYFNNNYYVLTAAGFVVVKNPTDYNGKGTRLSFESESYEQKLKTDPVSITSLTVWNNKLYFTSERSSCSAEELKTNPDCQRGSTIFNYGGQGDVKEHDSIPYSINLGISKEFKDSLYSVGTEGGLYKTADGKIFASVDHFANFIPNPKLNSRKITDLETVNDKLYAAVLVGRFDIPGLFNCNDKEEVKLTSIIVESYEIYSSSDGINWNKELSKDTLVKNYQDINFPIVNYNDQLYVGLTDSFTEGNQVRQVGNIYKLQ